MKKYRIMTNSYPVATLIADGFSSEAEALAYALRLQTSWCFGKWGWHIEEY